jgi:putative hydrolase of HD superfamily
LGILLDTFSVKSRLSKKLFMSVGNLDFLLTISNLKKTKRTGWLRNGIESAESIADHMHRMALISWILDDPSLNRDRLIKMAIVHDLAEATVGDITPDDSITKEEKERMERDAMDEFVKMLGNTDHAQELKELWEEYEAGNTPEAIACKDIDKFEMILQAYEYESEYQTKLDSFFASTNGRFKNPKMIEMVAELYKRRDRLHSK